jgi:hypothetical protein
MLLLYERLVEAVFEHVGARVVYVVTLAPQTRPTTRRWRVLGAGALTVTVLHSFTDVLVLPVLFIVWVVRLLSVPPTGILRFRYSPSWGLGRQKRRCTDI